MFRKVTLVVALALTMAFVGTAFAGPTFDVGSYAIAKTAYKSITSAEPFVYEAGELFQPQKDGDSVVPPMLNGDEIMMIGKVAFTTSVWMQLAQQSIDNAWKEFDRHNFYRAKASAEFAKSVSMSLVMFAYHQGDEGGPTPTMP